MSVLAALRYLKAEVVLAPNGGAIVRNVSPEWLSRARLEKAQITEILKSEVLDGIRYENSALFWQLEYLCRAMSAYPEDNPLCERLTQIVLEIDEAARGDMDQVEELIKERSEEVLRLVGELDGQQYLEGEELAAYARECLAAGDQALLSKMVAAANSEPAPTNRDLFESPPKAAVNMAAFE